MSIVRPLSSLLLALALLVPACSHQRRYPLAGQVLGVNVEQQQLTVKHEDIRGFMPAMTMPFTVRNPEDLQRHKPGDLIAATLVVEDNAGYLENIVKTGEAPLPPEASQMPAARMIEAGAEVPDAEFVDQAGRTVHLSDWRGKVTAVTFVYTRCPLPDFCPLMDRHFAAVQRALAEDRRLASRVHLVSVSFDPGYDTPDILRAHAERVSADPEHWSFVTGTPAAVDSFAGAFGVSIFRADEPMQEIVHNLRTAVIGPDGRLSTVLNGNDWKPEQLLEAIRAADAGG